MAEPTQVEDIAESCKPVDPSVYYSDPKDNPWEQKRKRPPRAVLVNIRRRNMPDWPNNYVRPPSDAPAAKSRWQKIIEHANSLADEQGMSREEFYSTALIEHIEKIENERLTEEYNEAHRAMGEEENLEFLNRLVNHYDPRLADE